MTTELCPACGGQNKAQAKFCRHCGMDLRRSLSGTGESTEAAAGFCGACGTGHQAGQVFCGTCGASLTAAASPQAVSPPQPNEQADVSQEDQPRPWPAERQPAAMATTILSPEELAAEKMSPVTGQTPAAGDFRFRQPQAVTPPPAEAAPAPSPVPAAGTVSASPKTGAGRRRRTVLLLLTGTALLAAALGLWFVLPGGFIQGGSDEVQGSYYIEGDTSSYLELRADGTYEAKEPDGDHMTGIYKTEENQVHFEVSGGVFGTMQREGGGLYDPSDDYRWHHR